MRNLDFIGHKLEFKFEGETIHKTRVGALLTILSFLSMLGLSAYFTYKLFERDEVTIIYNTQFKNDLKSMNFTNDQLSFLPVINDAPTSIDPSLLSIQWYKRIVINKVGVGLLPIETYPLSIKGCNKSDYEYLYENKEEAEKHATTYCVDFNNNVTLKESWGTNVREEIQYLRAYVSSCNNATLPSYYPFRCKPQEEIDKILDNAYFIVGMINSNINNNNVTHPLKDVFFTHYISFSSSISKTALIKKRLVDYTTDLGFVFTEEKLEKGSYDENPIQSYSNNLNNALLQVDITISETNEAYKRTYVKLQYLVANIGGVVRAITLIAAIINITLTRRNFITEISNMFINFDEFIDIKNNDKKDIKINFESKRPSSMNVNQHNNNHLTSLNPNFSNNHINQNNNNNNTNNKKISSKNNINNNTSNKDVICISKEIKRKTKVKIIPSTTNIVDNSNYGNINANSSTSKLQYSNNHLLNNLNVIHKHNESSAINRLKNNTNNKIKNIKKKTGGSILSLNLFNAICLDLFLKKTKQGKKYLLIEKYFYNILSLENIINIHFAIEQIADKVNNNTKQQIVSRRQSLFASENNLNNLNNKEYKEYNSNNKIDINNNNNININQSSNHIHNNDVTIKNIDESLIDFRVSHHEKKKLNDIIN